MQLNEALRYSFDDSRARLHRVVRGLDADALAWRPDPEANSVGWLVWHLARVADSHVAELAGREQVWSVGRWAEQLGLPAGYTNTGYGHTPEQVGQIRPDGGPLLGNLDAVLAMVDEYLAGSTEDEFDRVVDRSYDPPVTAGVRCTSVLGDVLQHTGQAA